MRVLFVIRSLDSGGGAERQLGQLARGLAARGHGVAIAVMYAGGALEQELEERHGVQILRLAKASRWDMVPFARRSIRMARAFNPDLVHGYMSGANELALFLGTALRRPTAWGIRVSDQDFGDYSRFREAVFQLGIHLARFPALIIANSSKGREFHLAKGFPADRFEVVPNGIDLARFTRNALRGAEWRGRHDVHASAPLIVLPARLDPMKDHRTFIEAARLTSTVRPDVRFLALGRGSEAERAALGALVRDAGLTDRVAFQPDESRVEDLYNAADIVTLTSAFGEGFPNVLGEAMSCARMCASTDAGDAKIVIGDAGRIVPVRAPEALSQAWLDLLTLSAADRAELERHARQRIEQNFGIELLIDVTLRHFEAALARAR
ncbi:MAG: glycosyltransferase [Gemmatimonadota bacterium]